jgi:hypothetical protein|nr:MAG TPA: hypothetical protein [Caudoviricetes sp.]
MITNANEARVLTAKAIAEQEEALKRSVNTFYNEILKLVERSAAAGQRAGRIMWLTSRNILAVRQEQSFKIFKEADLYVLHLKDDRGVYLNCCEEIIERLLAAGFGITTGSTVDGQRYIIQITW